MDTSMNGLPCLNIFSFTLKYNLWLSILSKSFKPLHDFHFHGIARNNNNNTKIGTLSNS